jgi:hypothetical protein
MMKFVILCTYLGPAMFLLYHSDRCNTSEMVFHWCYVNDLHTTHAVVCWVTTTVPRVAGGGGKGRGGLLATVDAEDRGGADVT